MSRRTSNSTRMSGKFSFWSFLDETLKQIRHLKPLKFHFDCKTKAGLNIIKQESQTTINIFIFFIYSFFASKSFVHQTWARVFTTYGFSFSVSLLVIRAVCVCVWKVSILFCWASIQDKTIVGNKSRVTWCLDSVVECI